MSALHPIATAKASQTVMSALPPIATSIAYFHEGGSHEDSRPTLLGVRPPTAVELLRLRRVKRVVRPALTPVSWREVIGHSGCQHLHWQPFFSYISGTRERRFTPESRHREFPSTVSSPNPTRSSRRTLEIRTQ